MPTILTCVNPNINYGASLKKMKQRQMSATGSNPPVSNSASTNNGPATTSNAQSKIQGTSS
jgi:hypothetical protein